MVLSLGQGSGDFAETSGRIQPFHIGFRNSVGILAPDAFTQANPPVVTTNVSDTLSGVTARGVLGGSVAFTRPDAGNGFIGGPVASNAAVKPLGLFINDANGNAYENLPGVASGRGPYFCGQGMFGLSVYETKNLNTGADLTWAPGDLVYASRNGLLTNVADNNNTQEMQSGLTAATVMGVVVIAPDADNSLLVVNLRV